MSIRTGKVDAEVEAVVDAEVERVAWPRSSVRAEESVEVEVAVGSAVVPDVEAVVAAVVAAADVAAVDAVVVAAVEEEVVAVEPVVEADVSIRGLTLAVPPVPSLASGLRLRKLLIVTFGGRVTWYKAAAKFDFVMDLHPATWSCSQ